MSTKFLEKIECEQTSRTFLRVCTHDGAVLSAHAHNRGEPYHASN